MSDAPPGDRAAATAGRVAALALVAGLALVSCTSDGPDAGLVSTGSGASMPAEDGDSATELRPVDRDAAVAAAVDIRADGCGPRVGFGTGSMIGDRTLATAAHVVAGSDSIEVIASDGDRTAGEVVLFDPDLDLAVIRTDAPVGTPLALRTTEAGRDETGIVVLPRLTAGELLVEVADVTVVRPANIRTTDIYLDQPVERPGFEIEGSIDPGDSGAMVVLPGGGVGIVWARSNVDERRAWAIDLPPLLLGGGAATLTTPVEVGPCIR